MEGKSFSYMIGMCVGIFVVVLVLTLIRKRRGCAGNEYDERQIMVRGNAFQKAFFTLMIYLMLDSIVSVSWRPWTTPGINDILGIFLAIGVFMMAAIRGDAYFSLKEKPRTFRLLCLIVIFCQLPNVIITVHSAEESFLTNGCLNDNCLSVACSVLFATVMVAITVHEKRRAAEDEDGEDA
ncbi:MAG: hypothetical protein KBS74_03950 [Clostridiales bacterium]|nr:hypothetical protein [Candidatus Cacconaster stercorequi]